MPYFIVGLVLATVVCGVVLFRRRRRDASDRMVSLVALLREPQFVDAGVLARAAREAWGVDLGDGQGEGPDGFVAGNDELPTMAVRYHERLLLIHRFGRPYVENPEEIAKQTVDLRLRSAIAGHRAWMSCDALSVNDPANAEELEEWYRLLGSLLAELVDDNTLAIYVPQINCLYACNQTTIECLQSNKPLAALQQELDPPVIQVADDDPRMLAAVEEAGGVEVFVRDEAGNIGSAHYRAASVAPRAEVGQHPENAAQGCGAAPGALSLLGLLGLVGTLRRRQRS